MFVIVMCLIPSPYHVTPRSDQHCQNSALRVPTRTWGEAVQQEPANHSVKEDRDQYFLCTQVPANYEETSSMWEN